MKPVVTFGELMLRLSPPGHLRLRQAMPGKLETSFAGAEANVAAAVALLGGRSRFVGALPAGPLGEAALAAVRSTGADVSLCLVLPRGRLGAYYVETGANQRAGTVHYDREHSAYALAGPDAYAWDAALADAGWFHTTGIAAGVSAEAAAATLEGVRRARVAGLPVSCDLNFRKKLWRWDSSVAPSALARRTMEPILEHVDVLIANEEDVSDVLGIHAGDTAVHEGRLDLAAYPEVAARVRARFPRLRLIAITLRESLSATHNNWGAMLCDCAAARAVFAPLDAAGDYRPHEIRAIVDRVGGGDSFAGGLLFALNTPALAQPETALRFAVATSCLAHSIKGDFAYVSRSEVEALMAGNTAGRVIR